MFKSSIPISHSEFPNVIWKFRMTFGNSECEFYQILNINISNYIAHKYGKNCSNRIRSLVPRG